MTSNSIYLSTFKPTCLMIKVHSRTGLKYLCKTIKTDINKYKGSGNYWKSHIKSHGTKFVSNAWYCWFYDKESLTECALMLSKLYDIVKSNEWANLIPEDGLGGGCISHTEETKIKISKSNSGKIRSEEHRRKLSKAHKNKILSEEHRRKLSASKIGMKTWNAVKCKTPWGCFDSIKDITQHAECNMSVSMLRKIFKNINQEITKVSRKKFDINDSITTWKEFGFELN